MGGLSDKLHPLLDPRTRSHRSVSLIICYEHFYESKIQCRPIWILNHAQVAALYCAGTDNDFSRLGKTSLARVALPAASDKVARSLLAVLRRGSFSSRVGAVDCGAVVDGGDTGGKLLVENCR